MEDSEKFGTQSQSDSQAKWIHLMRLPLELSMTIPDDATLEELQELLDTPPIARIAVSQRVWRRFWERERAGGDLPEELRLAAARRSDTEREEQERRVDKARRMRRLLEEQWRVAVRDDAATPEDLDFLIEQHRPFQRLLSSRRLMRDNWGIRLPDDATYEEHGEVLELLSQRLGRARIPKLLFWRRFWPRMRKDLLEEVRSHRTGEEQPEESR